MSSKSLVFGIQVWNHSETACENHYTIENERLTMSFDTLAICSSLYCFGKLWSIWVQKWIKRNFGPHICVHHRIRWAPNERAEEVMIKYKELCEHSHCTTCHGFVSSICETSLYLLLIWALHGWRSLDWEIINSVTTKTWHYYQRCNQDRTLCSDKSDEPRFLHVGFRVVDLMLFQIAG